MLMAKVGEETILETALVSLLPELEVEVGVNLIFTVLTWTCNRRALRSAAWQRPPTRRSSSTGTCCCFRRFSYFDRHHP